MFAAIGIALSAFGIYAVTAYAANRRTQEIGVRVALGARRSDVVWLILRGGLAQLAIALPIGLAGAVAAGRTLQGALFDISPLDAATFVSISLLLAAVVVLASLVPAWRAAQLNPLDAIRE
jgi:putative ABC transport system permease protein